MRGERVIQNGFRPGSQAESIDRAVTARALTVEEIATNAGEKPARVSHHCGYWNGLFYERSGERKYRRKPGRPQPGKP